jgi:hypothetical protein
MIVIPANAPTIDANFVYQPGVMISDSVSLDALTSGDTTPNSPFQLQRTSPLFVDYDPLQFDPFATGRPPLIAQDWQIAANLQYLAYGVVQPLLSYFGWGNIQPLCAYLDPERSAPNATFNESKHFSGEAIDFTVLSSASNIYNVLGDVLYALNGANGLQFVEMGLCYSAISWFHVGIAGPYSYSGGDYVNPRIFTRDFVSGESYTGFFPCRGISSN